MAPVVPCRLLLHGVWERRPAGIVPQDTCCCRCPCFDCARVASSHVPVASWTSVWYLDMDEQQLTEWSSWPPLWARAVWGSCTDRYSGGRQTGQHSRNSQCLPSPTESITRPIQHWNYHYLQNYNLVTSVLASPPIIWYIHSIQWYKWAEVLFLDVTSANKACKLISWWMYIFRCTH